MQKKCSKQILSCILCIVLIVAMALFTTGCNGSSGSQANVPTEASDGDGEIAGTDTAGDEPAGTDAAGDETTGADAAGDETTGADTGTDSSVLGEGSKVFTFTVVDEAGAQTQFEIHTDQETVGAALVELGLIDGDEGEYGLYVKTVNGITADYDADGKYWSFYINDEYAQTGVDATNITEGDSYSFKIEKA